MARTTVSTTISRIRRQLQSSQRGGVNVLATTINAVTPTVVLTNTFGAEIGVGSQVCIGLETMLVTAVNTGTKTLTVIRGWWDSTAAAATAGDVVWINPRFPPQDVYDALIDELNAWGPDIYRVVAQTFTVTDGQQTIELPAAWSATYGLVNAVRKWDAQSAYLDTVPTAWPRADIRFTRSTTDWAGATTSGLLLRLVDNVYAGKVNLTAALPLSTATISMTADLVADVGLQESMLDVLALGVKHRLLNDSENARTARMAQDEPRRAEETPVGASVQAQASKLAYYRMRFQQEANKLRALYPVQWS